MSHSCIEISDADRRVALLESKLEDTIDLLHLWKNEAYAYRCALDALLRGRFSYDAAKEALSSCDLARSVVYLVLSDEEREAFLAVARKARLEPSDFLWACVEAMMNNADDEDVLSGCREAVGRRDEL